MLRKIPKCKNIISLKTKFRPLSLGLHNKIVRSSSHKVKDSELGFHLKHFEKADKRLTEIHSHVIPIKQSLQKQNKISYKIFHMTVNSVFFLSAVVAGYYFIYYILDTTEVSPLSQSKDNYDEIEPKIKDEIDIDVKEEINPKEGFASVFGNEEAKEQLEDIVLFLKDPERFKTVNAKIPKGILLTGEPGCGKTLMARALAKEANVTYLHAAGSSFDEMFVGMGAKRIRKMFKRAREMSPCIIFIDELDSIGEKRSSISGVTSRMTLNQILSEIDGFTQNENIVVIGATNMPKRLDSALTRSGRFDRVIEVKLPDKKTRKEMLDSFLSSKPTESNLNIDSIVGQTIGMSGADLKNIVNLAAIEASNKGHQIINESILLKAVTQFSLGKVRSSLHLSEKVIFNTAVHEAGHAVVALFTENAPPVSQLTVLPRGDSLGSTWIIPHEESQYSQSRKQIEAMIDVAMGGHAAEEMFFGKNGATTGASSDFFNAAKMALAMTAQYGMSKGIGKFSVDIDKFEEFSPLLKEKVLTESKDILEEAYTRASALLNDKRKALTDLVDEVVREETLDKEKVYSIAGVTTKD